MKSPRIPQVLVSQYLGAEVTQDPVATTPPPFYSLHPRREAPGGAREASRPALGLQPPASGCRGSPLPPAPLPPVYGSSCSELQPRSLHQLLSLLPSCLSPGYSLKVQLTESDLRVESFAPPQEGWEEKPALGGELPPSWGSERSFSLGASPPWGPGGDSVRQGARTCSAPPILGWHSERGPRFTPLLCNLGMYFSKLPSLLRGRCPPPRLPRFSGNALAPGHSRPPPPSPPTHPPPPQHTRA